MGAGEGSDQGSLGRPDRRRHDQAEGNRDQLVGTIREKTGETVEAIESKLDDIFAQGN